METLVVTVVIVDFSMPYLTLQEIYIDNLDF